jgi:hypothetical protein
MKAPEAIEAHHRGPFEVVMGAWERIRGEEHSIGLIVDKKLDPGSEEEFKSSLEWVSLTRVVRIIDYYTKPHGLRAKAWMSPNYDIDEDGLTLSDMDYGLTLTHRNLSKPLARSLQKISEGLLKASAEHELELAGIQEHRDGPTFVSWQAVGNWLNQAQYEVDAEVVHQLASPF